MSRTTLTDDERRAYRRKLLALADRLADSVAQLEDEAQRPTGAEGTAADAPARDPVPAGREADEDVARAVMLTEGQILAEAHAALGRLDAGTFGACERCGRAISRARLDAVPYARQCARCAGTADAGA